MPLTYHFLIPGVLILVCSFWLGQIPYTAEYQGLTFAVSAGAITASLWIMYADATRVGARIGPLLPVLTIVLNPIGWLVYAIKSRGLGFWRVFSCYLLGLALHIAVMLLGQWYAFGTSVPW
jgi:hypothetical protein